MKSLFIIYAFEDSFVPTEDIEQPFSLPSTQLQAILKAKNMNDKKVQ